MIPILSSFLFLTAMPNTMARMGPISGDTSMEATRMTLEFSTRPMKARQEATTRRQRKSKENSAPHSILNS